MLRDDQKPIDKFSSKIRLTLYRITVTLMTALYIVCFPIMLMLGHDGLTVSVMSYGFVLIFPVLVLHILIFLEINSECAVTEGTDAKGVFDVIFGLATAYILYALFSFFTIHYYQPPFEEVRGAVVVLDTDYDSSFINENYRYETDAGVINVPVDIAKIGDSLLITDKTSVDGVITWPYVCTLNNNCYRVLESDARELKFTKPGRTSL